MEVISIIWIYIWKRGTTPLQGSNKIIQFSGLNSAAWNDAFSDIWDTLGFPDMGTGLANLT